VSRTGATLIGVSAILMWSGLAVLTRFAGNLPPLELTGFSFLIGGLLGSGFCIWRGGSAFLPFKNWKAWAVGVGGLFFYHLTYFAAMARAPAMEVSLIAYLWPLLIVVLSALLPGERLRFHHVLGVLLGFAGAALVISKGNFGALMQNLTLGHGLAFLCALIWGLYSVLSRQLKQVPTDAVAGFCLVTGVLALSVHFAIETTVLPQHAGQWLAIALLGMFPVGLAFFTWDYGVKHGDIMALGAASYLSPMLSAIALVVSGIAQFSFSLVLACLLIMCGAIVAAKDMIFKKTI
jgi:drug/metabolite transporter (DMT)-like permease